MDRDWIQNLTKSVPVAWGPDVPDRGERYIAVVEPYWNSLKRDVKSAVGAFNERQSSSQHRVSFEDAGAKILLRGDCHALDVKLELEHERLRAFYSEWRDGRTSTAIVLRFDMREDYLAIMDCRGCIVEEPTRFILERFFRALAAPPRVRRTRAPLW